MHKNVPFSGMKFQNFLGRSHALSTSPTGKGTLPPHPTLSMPSASRSRCLRHVDLSSPYEILNTPLHVIGVIVQACVTSEIDF